MTRLDADSQSQRAGRKAIGMQCIELACGGDDHLHLQEERETYAADAISDILTALYGPAGAYDVEGKLESEDAATETAYALLQRAFHSWLGDAEDYTRRANDAVIS